VGGIWQRVSPIYKGRGKGILKTKKTKIIISCERCKKTFVVEREITGCAVSMRNQSSYNPDFTFNDNNPLNYHKYLSGINKSGTGFDLSPTDPVALCEACDVEFWKNFAKAVDVLKSFWVRMEGHDAEL
jgi:hypothetical protein